MTSAGWPVWVDLGLVLFAVVVLVFVLTTASRPDRRDGGARGRERTGAKREADAPTPSAANPERTSSRDVEDVNRVLSALEPTSSELGPSRVARRRLTGTASVLVRTDSGSYPARVLEYSVDGSRLSVLGPAVLQRGDRVRVVWSRSEVHAEVCHPVGQVAEKEWVAGLYFPALPDRLQLLEHVREVNRLAAQEQQPDGASAAPRD